MKLFLAGLVAAAAAMSTVAVPAQSAPVASAQAAASADPVKALKAQLVAGKGVKITETSSITVDATIDGQSMQVKVSTRTAGALAFGKGKVAAADLRVRMSSRVNGSRPSYRVVAEGRNAYVTNPGIAKALPSGRSWVHEKTSERENSILTNGITPADLQFMLKNSTMVTTGEYEGTASLVDFQQDKNAGEGTVEFRLYFDKNNLLTRTVVNSTTYPDEGSSAYDQMIFRTDTRYSGWGAKVKITAPAAAKVISEKKLNAKTRKAVVKAGYPDGGPF
ncbi:hypothetical protein HII36_02525 [Nonomuraea sp. NN258]|uniref:hypothetical protein n=1 Tax=Nonomuraea antri TaxID=2730852 RepID=UPI001568349B|nr:hypothetical protein [Nonomuraea antri]NRQ30713.1 hypothetical protein [Nonomuraea antri]